MPSLPAEPDTKTPLLPSSHHPSVPSLILPPPQPPPPVIFTPLDLDEIQHTFDSIQAFRPLFHQAVYISRESILQIVTEAHITASESYTTRSAREWAGDYIFPRAQLQRHATEFSSSHSNFKNLCTLRHRRHRHSRLSLRRVHDCFGPDGKKIPNLPARDFDLLCSLASEGIRLTILPEFTPTSSPPPLRAKYVSVAPAIHKMFGDQLLDDTVLILPLAQALLIPGIHFSDQHWTTKKGKAQGRGISDLANAHLPELTPLNGTHGEAKKQLQDLLKAHYGPIHHPTLVALALMVLEMADKYGWDNIELWKKDLRGAFTLLWFHHSAIAKLAFLLQHDLVVFHLAGLFGWTGMPYVFQVITRVLLCLLATVIVGKCLMYVDDVMGVSPTASASKDSDAADSAIKRLMGKYAVATHKDERGRILEFIGWLFNLNTRTVSLSRRLLVKTIHAFFSFNIDAAVTKDVVDRMASLATRASLLFRPMRPYTHALYSMINSFPTPHATRHLTPAAKTEIIVWRTFLIISHFDEQRLQRPIETFRPRPPSVLFEYDASLSMLSVGMSLYNATTKTATLIAYVAIPLPFPPTSDSSKQNTFEYLAVFTGLLLAASYSFKNFAYRLMGDSIASLTWTHKDRAPSVLAHRANIALTLLSATIDATPIELQHVPGVDNVVYDGLSRGKTGGFVGLDPLLQIHTTPSHPFVHLLQLCDPDLPLSGALEHAAFSSHLLTLFSTLPYLSPYFPTLPRHTGNPTTVPQPPR